MDDTISIEANSCGHKHGGLLAPLVKWKWISKSQNSLISTSRSVDVNFIVIQTHGEALETVQFFVQPPIQLNGHFIFQYLTIIDELDVPVFPGKVVAIPCQGERKDADNKEGK